MRIPFSRMRGAVKMGAQAVKESDAVVRVSVYVDRSATPFLIDAVRQAFVPQTTSGIVRVFRLEGAVVPVREDTDVAIVLSCGSASLEPAVQRIVIAGAPVVVIAESSVEVPFISEDTRMLGLISSTHKTYLLETLARWILDRTEKGSAFAANFAFMRIAAAHRVIRSCALTNMMTGALEFIPGADYPVMTMAQIGMMFELSTMYGKPLRVERAYEAAAVAGSGLLLRFAARGITARMNHGSFVAKALIGAAGTYAMGCGLAAFYERDVDYAPLNQAFSVVASQAKRGLQCVLRAVGRPAADSSAVIE